MHMQYLPSSTTTLTTAKDLAAKSVQTGTDHGKGKQTDSWVFADSRVLAGDSKSMQEWDLDSE